MYVYGELPDSVKQKGLVHQAGCTATNPLIKDMATGRILSVVLHWHQRSGDILFCLRSEFGAFGCLCNAVCVSLKVSGGGVTTHVAPVSLKAFRGMDAVCVLVTISVHQLVLEGWKNITYTVAILCPIGLSLYPYTLMSLIKSSPPKGERKCNLINESQKVLNLFKSLNSKILPCLLPSYSSLGHEIFFSQ